MLITCGEKYIRLLQVDCCIVFAYHWRTTHIVNMIKNASNLATCSEICTVDMQMANQGVLVKMFGICIDCHFVKWDICVHVVFPWQWPRFRPLLSINKNAVHNQNPFSLLSLMLTNMSACSSCSVKQSPKRTSPCFPTLQCFPSSPKERAISTSSSFNRQPKFTASSSQAISCPTASWVPRASDIVLLTCGELGLMCSPLSARPLS